jgi:hypothetical protein
MTDISVIFLQEGIVSIDEYRIDGPQLNVHFKYPFGQLPLGAFHFRSETLATIA